MLKELLAQLPPTLGEQGTSEPEKKFIRETNVCKD